MKKTLLARVIMSALLILSSSNALQSQDIMSSVANGKIDEIKTMLAKGANPAKSYNKAEDKSNVAAGITGIWEKYYKVEGITHTTRVVMRPDWSYSKSIKPSDGQWMTDGPGYNTYELRDGRIWIFINNSFPAVVEYRLEGKDLVMNDEKYVKVLK